MLHAPVLVETVLADADLHDDLDETPFLALMPVPVHAPVAAAIPVVSSAPGRQAAT
jgi:hypothetical protein